ncbi:MAG: SigE family RNA polymerase sigma factor [Actinomycetia bacterium]|nr:SigE family RNA polymerase sigma factor [Actinomycetes bacterium]
MLSVPGVAESGTVAFAQFVREQTPALLRSAYLLTGDRLEAEELVQDTLARLYPKWARVQRATVPLAYVRRCLANGFVNSKRGGARRELLVDLPPERPFGTDIATAVADGDQVWRLLATLAPRQRAALVLRYFHGATDAEIAEALGCRTGTVRSLLSRGLATLRDEIGTGDDDE